LAGSLDGHQVAALALDLIDVRRPGETMEDLRGFVLDKLRSILQRRDRMMIENAYASARIGVTADDMPPDKAETTPSPRGLPMSVFAESARIVEVRPGRMGLHGRTEVSALPAGQVVGRVLVLNADGAPLIISSINGGLTLDGADVFETIKVLRLINRGQPRTEFS
jgi:hypothetical protein